jgi:hypothetical protein
MTGRSFGFAEGYVARDQDRRGDSSQAGPTSASFTGKPIVAGGVGWGCDRSLTVAALKSAAASKEE